VKKKYYMPGLLGRVMKGERLSDVIGTDNHIAKAPIHAVELARYLALFGVWSNWRGSRKRLQGSPQNS
jgi:hypothetical protein